MPINKTMFACDFNPLRKFRFEQEFHKMMETNLQNLKKKIELEEGLDLNQPNLADLMKQIDEDFVAFQGARKYLFQ